jgi:hypothetical protein
MSKITQFSKELLRNYQILDRAGTFIVTVAYDITEDSIYLEDGYPRYLIPLRVIRSADLVDLLKAVKDGPVPFKSVKSYFVTGAIFDNNDIDPIDLPTKGEKVVATFDEIDGKLMCTHIKLIDRDDLMYVNYSAIDELYNLAENFISK